MKTAEQQEARRLRGAEGLSLNEIAARLNVSKSSVSLWVRNVPLSEAHIERLAAKNPLYNRQLHSSGRRREIGRAARARYQEEGRQRARQSDLCT